MKAEAMSLAQIGRDGELRLTFERRAQGTVLTGNYSRPPLQVMRAIPDPAGGLTVYLLSPTGGVVQGDRYRIDLQVGAGAHAIFTTQSATKIYKMPEGCAEQMVRITIGDGAFLEYLPDAAILFAEADFHQRTQVVLGAGALGLFQEVVMPGRLARGERLAFRRFSSRFSAEDRGGLLVHEAARIEPAAGSLESVGRLEGYSCWGSAYLIGDLAAWKIDAGVLMERLVGIISSERLPKQDGIAGVSLLARSGLCVRVLSHRLETVYAILQALRDLVRSMGLGLVAAPLRK